MIVLRPTDLIIASGYSKCTELFSLEIKINLLCNFREICNFLPKSAVKFHFFRKIGWAKLIDTF